MRESINWKWILAELPMAIGVAVALALALVF